MVSTVVRNILNVSVFALPYVWPHAHRKTSMGRPANAQALPYDMEYHTVNNEEHPWSRLRWIAGVGPPPRAPRRLEKDSELNGCLCSHKKAPLCLGHAGWQMCSYPLALTFCAWPMEWACAVWCLCQTLRDFRCCSLMCSYRTLIALKKKKRAGRLYGVGGLWAIEEKLSSHRCSMTSSAEEGDSLLAAQWNVKRFYLAVGEMYRFSQGCAVLGKKWKKSKEKHGAGSEVTSLSLCYWSYHSVQLFTSQFTYC